MIDLIRRGPVWLNWILIALLSQLLLSCSNDSSDSNKDNSPVDHSWESASPASQKLDADLIQQASERAAELDNIYSLLIARNGLLVSENYYNGREADDLNHVRSVTKSIISILVGQAIEQGYIDSVYQTISDFFPEHFADNQDADKATLNIEHFLTQTSGYAWNEDTEGYNWFFLEEDHLNSALDRSLVHTPGDRFNYDSASVHILSVALSRAVGTSTRSFAEEQLFGPLGIESYAWEQDAQGNDRGGAGLELRPRDMAKIGQLMLDNGQWRGVQILPEEWVQLSRHWFIDFDDSSSYGYLWWINTIAGFEMYYALGWGGQFIIVVPKAAMVIVASHDHFVFGDSGYQQLTTFLIQVLPFILAAAVE